MAASRVIVKIGTSSLTDERMAMGLCYTSGTTGNPKGALYSHRSMFLHTLGGNQAMAIGLAAATMGAAYLRSIERERRASVALGLARVAGRSGDPDPDATLATTM